MSHFKRLPLGGGATAGFFPNRLKPARSGGCDFSGRPSELPARPAERAVARARAPGFVRFSLSGGSPRSSETFHDRRDHD
jgi:hypothetical protein